MPIYFWCIKPAVERQLQLDTPAHTNQMCVQLVNVANHALAWDMDLDTHHQWIKSSLFTQFCSLNECGKADQSIGSEAFVARATALLKWFKYTMMNLCFAQRWLELVHQIGALVGLFENRFEWNMKFNFSFKTEVIKDPWSCCDPNRNRPLNCAQSKFDKRV